MTSKSEIFRESRAVFAKIIVNLNYTNAVEKFEIF
jgi:hypothetical protein